MSPPSATEIELLPGWPVGHAAMGWLAADGRGERAATPGTDPIAGFRLASVTKVLFGVAVLVAVEEGTVDLDDPAGPPGSTVRHLLSHASGLSPDAAEPIAPPGTRRIYSNAGFDALGAVLTQASGMDYRQYVREAVFEPLGMSSTVLEGSPAHSARSNVPDLLVLIGQLLTPSLISRTTLLAATEPQFAGLGGILPGFGRQDPNPWGLGFEIRGSKHPHWTGTHNSPETFGHFGRSGTMFWVDPVARVGCVALSDVEFGPWAARAWPALSDAVIERANPDL